MCVRMGVGEIYTYIYIIYNICISAEREGGREGERGVGGWVYAQVGFLGVAAGFFFLE